MIVGAGPLDLIYKSLRGISSRGCSIAEIGEAVKKLRGGTVAGRIVADFNK